MTDIFLSRPTDVPENQQQGLNNLQTLLNFAELNPRTLGSTDYPNESPLNEIIQILQTCSGMLVLGYPKFIVEQGLVKGVKITEPIKLASEWNQIEATLAYSSQMPLLIICDKGVSFGFFDRGAANCFVHEVDFSDPQWCMSVPIQGAIQKWKERIAEYNKRKKNETKHTEESKRKLISLKNDLLEMLEKKVYNKKHNQSVNPNFDYSAANLGSGCVSPLSEFLHRNVETAYEQNMRRSGNKTKNQVLNELNESYPDVYAKLVELFDREGFNKEDFDKCFENI